MHHRTSLAALSLLVVGSGVLGCVAPEGAAEPTTEDALVGAPSACTQVVDARNNHVAKLEVEDGLLTIAQSSDDGHFPPMSHALRRVMLVVEPDEHPNFECSHGDDVIKIWNDFARVDAAYYRLTSPPGETPETLLAETEIAGDAKLCDGALSPAQAGVKKFLGFRGHESDVGVVFQLQSVRPTMAEMIVLRVDGPERTSRVVRRVTGPISYGKRLELSVDSVDWSFVVLVRAEDESVRSELEVSLVGLSGGCEE
jgi:hypothetical protein